MNNKLALTWLSGLMVSAWGWLNAGAADLPRYKFESGQELVYAVSSEFNFGSGAFKDASTDRFWVTGQNSDGSWHLVYIGEDKHARTGDFSETNTTISYGQLDLLPDGRSVVKTAKKPGEHAHPAFFPLPADTNQASNGWQFAENEAQQKAYKVKQAGKPWIIQSTAQGIFHDIYEMSESDTIYFNADLGLVEKIETESAQGYGFNGHGTGVVELKAHTTRDKDWIAQLVADATAIDKAQASVDDALASIKTGATNTESIKAAAKQALASAAANIKNPQLRDKLNSDLQKLDNRFRYTQEDNDRKDAVLNKPAPTWTTTDLDGQTHSLEDYRGKVIALDFWYRGCGWCLRAMPQVKALADQFHGQPVVILGMNTDGKDKDAQFVIDKLQLNYPTLHATGIPQKYGVQGFPTFIVIDQKGIVRAQHVGYSPTLREEMAKTISSLLSETK